MRLQVGFTTAFALVATLLTCNAAPPADFSGDWQLVPDKSTGVPSGMPQGMTVKQTGERIEVQLKLGERTVTDTYVVNGKEAEFTPAVMGGGTAKNGKRIATWQPEGAGFDSTEEATIEGSEGTDTVKGKRSWRLSADGKELTIEIELRGDQVDIKSKRVFVKK